MFVLCDCLKGSKKGFNSYKCWSLVELGFFFCWVKQTHIFIQLRAELLLLSLCCEENKVLNSNSATAAQQR